MELIENPEILVHNAEEPGEYNSFITAAEPNPNKSSLIEGEV